MSPMYSAFPGTGGEAKHEKPWPRTSSSSMARVRSSSSDARTDWKRTGTTAHSVCVVNSIASSTSVRRVATTTPAGRRNGSSGTAASQNVTGTVAAAGG